VESAKKKEILNSYLEALKEWRYWKDETERLMVAATGASPSLSGMPHGGGTGTSKVELAAESLEDARRELTAAANAMSKARRQVLAGDGQAAVLAGSQAHQRRAQCRAVAGNVFNFRVSHIYPGIVQQVNALRLFFQQFQLRVFQLCAFVYVGSVRQDCRKVAVGNLEAGHFVPAARIIHS
jgi:hypothetical protein